jgi:hypothetical protein
MACDVSTNGYGRLAIFRNFEIIVQIMGKITESPSYVDLDVVSDDIGQGLTIY